MSTIDRPNPMTLPRLEPGQRLDRATFHARYEAMPPRTRAELIGGVVYMPSPLRNDHGDTGFYVAGWLAQYLRVTPGMRGSENATVFLDPESEAQPDVSLRVLPEYGGQTRVSEDGYLTGPPEMIVEIARSSRKFDLGEKLRDYERGGVLEYVVVALEPDEVYWFVRRGDRFEPLPPGPDGRFRSEVYPGLWLDPAALYADDLDRLLGTLERGLATPEHAEFVTRLAARRAAG